MTIYTDSDYRCHTADDSTMRTFGLPFFDENILLSLKDIDIYRPSNGYCYSRPKYKIFFIYYSEDKI